MGADPDGNGSLSIRNAEGNPLALMGVDPDGNGSVQTHNAEGEILAFMGADPNGIGTVWIGNAESEILAFMGADPNGNVGTVATTFGGQRMLIVLGVDSKGNGKVFTYDRRGELKNQ